MVSVRGEWSGLVSRDWSGSKSVGWSASKRQRCSGAGRSEMVRIWQMGAGKSEEVETEHRLGEGWSQ